MTKFQKIICLLLAVGIVLLLAVGGAGIYVLNRNMGRSLLPESEDRHHEDGGGDSNEALLPAEDALPDNPFYHLYHELREPDANTFQMTLMVTAYPEVFTEKTRAQLVCGDKTVPMAFSGGTFTGKIALPLEAKDINYSVLLEHDGVIHSQDTTMKFPLAAIGKQVFGDQRDWGKMIGYGPDAQYQLDTTLEVNGAFLPFSDQMVSARAYVQDAAGEELFSVAMSENVITLDQRFALPENKEVMVYGEVKGKSGMTHTYPICRLWNKGDYVEEYLYPGEIVRIVGAHGRELEMYF